MYKLIPPVGGPVRSSPAAQRMMRPIEHGLSAQRSAPARKLHPAELVCSGRPSSGRTGSVTAGQSPSGRRSTRDFVVAVGAVSDSRSPQVNCDRSISVSSVTSRRAACKGSSPALDQSLGKIPVAIGAQHEKQPGTGVPDDDDSRR